MACFDNTDAVGPHAMCVAGNHDAFKRHIVGPRKLNSARHAGRSFTGSNDQRLPFWFCGKILGNDFQRIGCRNGRMETVE